ncbi:uncharacterized protein LOC129323855 [Eublepharis macularius]|uniref:Uncharacterized protein LOC129323853 n=1 Tax=Eublepharis macularius TaxID=481883 RepID=A0AA97KP21_EUBMA|nr:uncharacterized protein LOC129323853 [Eublepharis macularius]XP_054826596.1 uncharacterized protein LOC129323855 [Eublepharis macularius]
MGDSGVGPVCDCGKSQGPSLLFQRRSRPRIKWGRVSVKLVRSPVLCLPSVPASGTGPQQDPEGQSVRHPGDPVLAEATMVSLPSESTDSIDPSPGGSRSPDLRGGSSPRHQETQTHSVVDQAGAAFSEAVTNVLLNARRLSTRQSYALKWDKFSVWCSRRGLDPFESTLSEILDFLWEVKQEGLANSSVKVYLAAISAFHPPVDRKSVFSHYSAKLFLRGLNNLFPPVRALVPQWSLPLVLTRLMSKPFEPLASCPLRFLSMKVAFLVAATSARRVGELAALSCEPPYLKFHPEKVVLRTKVEFLPKVVSRFHLSQELVLPVFFPTPASEAEAALHSLDVRRAILFYLDRVKPFRIDSNLFICFAGPKKGNRASAQSISRWVVQAILTCYSAANLPCPLQVHAHSTRSQASSAALFRGVPLQDICRAATWASADTFVKHYALDILDRKETAVGTAVLHSIFE